MFSATQATRAGRAAARSARAARRARRASAAGSPGSPRSRSRPRLVAEHERVRRRAVDQAERDARVRRVERASPGPRRRAARRRGDAPSTTSCSAAPAMKSATTASTAIPQPAIAIPVWPVGTNTTASPRRARLAVELERDRHLPDRAVGADGEDDRRAGSCRFSPVGTFEAGGRLAQVAQLDAVLARRARPAPGRRETNSCRPFSTSSPAAIALLQQLAPRRREAAALGRDADERGRRLVAQRLRRPCATTGNAVVASRRARVESRIATTSSGA